MLKLSAISNIFAIKLKYRLIINNIIAMRAEFSDKPLTPSDTEVSTQEAADMVNVSRPHLVKLLEEGEIPFIKVGSHRRIEVKNIVAYEKRLKENRSEELDFLAKQAQDHNLGYQ